MCGGLSSLYLSPSVLYPSLLVLSLPPVCSGVDRGLQSGPSHSPTVEATLEPWVFPRDHRPGTVSPAALEGVALPADGGVA